MATKTASFAETIEILWDILGLKKDEALAKIKSIGLSYTKTLLLILALWAGSTFFLIYLKALTGIKFFAFLAALVSFVFAVAMRILWLPISTCLSMMAQETLNPAKASEDYMKRSAMFVLAGLSASLYAMNNPIENNTDLLMGLAVAFIALLLLIYIAGTVVPINVYAIALGIYIIYTTLLFRTDKPIDYLLSGCNQQVTYSIYQGKTYGSSEEITVYNKPGEFSSVITLSGVYKPRFVGSAELLPAGSNTAVKIKSGERFNLDFNTFQVRSQLDWITFVPANK
ncbi:MAG: hypothetical protein Q8Q95_03615 [bacterium]|nr:hypothetical protein [bacterium]